MVKHVPEYAKDAAPAGAAIGGAAAAKPDTSVAVAENVTADKSLIDAGLDLDADIDRVRRMREKQPFGAFDRKLDLQPINGYKQHWFNDKPGRIERALSAGWTYVLDDGKPKTLIVDSGGLKAYALKIPEEFWAEDVKRAEQKAKAPLDAVKKKPSQSGQQISASDQGAFYTPHASGEAAEVTRGKP